MTATRPLPKGLNAAEKTIASILLCVLFFAMEYGAGSSLEFSGLVTVYVATVLVAIRCCGGGKTVFGAIVFWYATQHVLFSQVAKAVVGEAPESRLSVPIPTILSEILVMLGFAAGGIVALYFRPNRDRPLFPPVTDIDALKKLAGAATLLAIIRNLLIQIVGIGGVGVLRPLGSIDSLAVSAAVAVAVVQSGGKRLTNPLVLITFLPLMLITLISGGRQGVVSLAIAVVLGGWAFGYRFRVQHYVSAIVIGLVMVFIISPYGLAVRSKSRSGTLLQRFDVAIDTLMEVAADPLKYQVSTPEEIAHTRPEALRATYFELPPGAGSSLLDRFGLIKPNDLIVQDTLRYGTTGWANITPGLPRLLPSFLTADKSILATGNSLAHRVPELVTPNDYTTGITIGLTADAFSAFKYWGAFLFAFVIMLVNVVAHKLVIRLDMRRNLFALAIVVPTAHIFSESNAINMVAIATYNLALTVLAFLTSTTAMKLLDFRYLRPRRSRMASMEDEVGAPA